MYRAPRNNSGFLHLYIYVVFLCLAVLSIACNVFAVDTSGPAAQAIMLAQKGRCREALPLLKKSTLQITDKQLRYQTAMMTARCAMSLDQTESAVRALLRLNREFPHDPDVLYTTTHFYSELASRASQELAATAPNSPQAQQLEAEAFESQGNWGRAAAQYRQILQQAPKTPGIHYRLGRIALSKSPPETENAQKEFEEELRIDPGNASAEFMLGETARQAGRWEDAIGHFSRASQLDESFVEAYLALGMSLNSAGKFSEAVAPLEKYVKSQPEDPAGHYQLATAYARTGHKPQAEHEMTLQREAAAKNPQQAH
ncbi:MAG: tetratricopeptide repeat protein [Terriglobales bacterium]